MRLAHEVAEVGARAVMRMDVVVARDVVAVVLERRGVEGQQPDRVDAEVLDVVELRGEALKVADAVVVRVEERLDVQLVDDDVLVPEGQALLGPRCGLRRRRGGRAQAITGHRSTRKTCAGSVKGLSST